MRITQPLMRSGLLLAIASLPLASQASAQGVVQGAAAPTLQGGQARPVQGAPAPAPQGAPVPARPVPGAPAARPVPGVPAPAAQGAPAPAAGQPRVAPTAAAPAVSVPAAQAGPVDPLIEEVAATEEGFIRAFNEGKADVVASMFSGDCELITEDGTQYHGQEEIKQLFTQYFADYPGVKVGLDIESIRSLGDNLAVEEGTRYVGINDQPLAQVRYVATLAKQDGKWKLASVREFSDTVPMPNGGHLEPIAWMVGDWVSEGSDVVMKISYRWDESQNFIVGTFTGMQGDQVVLKSDQRIGWDPSVGKIRSWFFDSDGGFATGYWTLLEEGWVLKSQSTSTDGSIGFADVIISPLDENRFRMVGADRIVDNERLPGFDVIIAKAPPKPTDASAAAQPAAQPAAAAPVPAAAPAARPAPGVQPGAPVPAVRPAPGVQPGAPVPAAPRPAAPQPARVLPQN